MATLYDELLAGLTKQASTEDTIKQGISELDNNELLILAAELAELTGDSELAEMAKVLPVYSSGQQINKEIKTEQAIQTSDPNPAPASTDNSNVVVASEVVEGTEKVAEDDKKDDDKKDDDKKDDKEDKGEEKKDDKEDKSEEKKDDEEEDEDDGKSAAEYLYELLKEGAAVEELIEVRAAQMLDAMIKEAEDMETAKGIVDAAAAHLADNAVKAYDFSMQMMDKAKTVATKNCVNIVDAAKAVASDVAGFASKIAPTVIKAADATLDELDKQAAELEAAYEKLAEQVDTLAEQMLIDAGTKQGLVDPKLHDFVQKGLVEVRTLAAKKDINIAQAAKEYLAGNTGAKNGVEEPSAPSPSQAPSPAAAPINSNQTQSPDQFIPQMISAVEPNPETTLETMVSPEVKQAAMEFLMNLIKEASAKKAQDTQEAGAGK